MMSAPEDAYNIWLKSKMKPYPKSVTYRAWMCKSAIVFLILFLLLAVSLYGHNSNAMSNMVTKYTVNQRELASQSLTSESSLQGYPNAQAFASRCNPEDLYGLQYSDLFKVHVPVQSHKRTTCKRRLEAAKFPIPYTGLLSFPGSGNTWTRHLLQELTGLPTGSSSIPDLRLKENGFPFEGELENVIAVKSHGKIHEAYSRYVPTSNFSRLIIVLRNPYNCIVSEYKRKNSQGSHVEDVYVQSGTRLWHLHLEKRIQAWDAFFTDTFAFTGPIFIMFYEDLKSQLLTELVRLASFLKSDDLSDFSFCCALKNQTGNFQRPASRQSLNDIFSDSDRAFVNRVITNTAALLKARFPEEADRFYSFLLPKR